MSCSTKKTVLLDTVDQSVAGQFFENLAHVLGGRPLDYIVVHHMEPDHAKTLEETVRRYPEAKIICNAKIRDMIRNYFTFDIDARAILMAEGRYIHLRQAHVCLCHGADGPLAGGHGQL